MVVPDAAERVEVEARFLAGRYCGEVLERPLVFLATGLLSKRSETQGFIAETDEFFEDALPSCLRKCPGSTIDDFAELICLGKRVPGSRGGHPRIASVAPRRSGAAPRLRGQ